MTSKLAARTILIAAILTTCAWPADARSKWWLSWLDELSGPGPFNGKTLVAELWCVPAEDNASVVALDDRIDRLTAELDGVRRTLASNEAVRILREPKPEAVQSETAVQLAKQLEMTTASLAAAQAALEGIRRNRFCRASRDNALFSVVFETGWWDDQPNGRYDDSLDTDVRLYQAVVYFPLHRVLRQNMSPESGIRASQFGTRNRLYRAIELGTGFGAYRLSGDTIRDPELWRGSIPFRVRIIPSELFYGGGNPVAERQPIRVLLQAIQFRFGGDLLPGPLTSSAFVGLEVDERTEWLWTRSVQIDLGAILWSSFRR